VGSSNGGLRYWRFHPKTYRRIPLPPLEVVPWECSSLNLKFVALQALASLEEVFWGWSLKFAALQATYSLLESWVALSYQ
jgi:hypothetical protein